MNTKRSIMIAALLCAPVFTSFAQMPASFTLDHRDNGFGLSFSLPLDSKEVVFSTEPDFKDHEVTRSAIVTGPGPQDFIGFAWDRTAEKLHVDLNGDLDLTNDENGTFESADRGGFMQEFENIRLRLEHDGVSVPYVLRVYFYTYSGSRKYGNLTVLSGWRGEIELHGKRWTLSVVDNLDGALDQGDQFILSPLPAESGVGMVHRQTMPGASGLHLAGRAYDLDFTFKGSPEESVLALGARDADVAMGTMNIEGSSIKRLVLHPSAAGGYLVVADEPEASLAVPAGPYGAGMVYLDGGEKLVFEARLPGLSVTGAEPATLKAGGPLNNAVMAEGHGSTIELSYELRGAGGEEYRGLLDDRRHPPRFVVHKGPLKLHSGEFEYG